MMDQNAALVLFSGGQDSATCLAWALALSLIHISEPTRPY